MGADAVVGERVSLRAIREDDLASIEPWFGEAVAAAGSRHPRPLSLGAGEGRFPGSEKNGVLVIERVGVNEPIGIVEWDVGDHWLTIAFVALAKAYRGLGYGSEAVR